MKICSKCNELFPHHIVINGKRHSLSNRRYCLNCSPFGQHNTCQIEKFDESSDKYNICTICNKKHSQRGYKCMMCYFNEKKEKNNTKICSIVGKSCWICGYNKTKRNLCFHHVWPELKLFSLTSRELMLKWSRVLNEMKKCILVCCNCHGEIHSNLIPYSDIIVLYEKKWKEINKNLNPI